MLKKLQVEAKKAGDWSKKFLTLDDCSTVVDESCEIFGPDGKRAALLLRGGVSQENIAKAWHHLRTYNPSTSNRGTASGVSKLRVRQDGSVSKTDIGETVNSGVIGFYDRYPRIPFCRKCAWNQQHPEAFETMIPLFQECSEAFKKYWPEKFQLQADVAQKTHKDFVIPGTAFTTVTVNKNYRTACHVDPRNLEESIATMLVLHDGRLDGGELILPEFDLGLRFRSGDLAWFLNTNLWHGNAPIVRYGTKSQRCSLVMYFRKGMVNCGSHEEELARAKKGLRTTK